MQNRWGTIQVPLTCNFLLATSIMNSSLSQKGRPVWEFLLLQNFTSLCLKVPFICCSIHVSADQNAKLNV